jgi:asparagine synthase (glutamine-hydrolysing)
MGRLIPSGAAAIGSRVFGGATGSRQVPRAAARMGRGLSMIAVDGEASRFAALRSFINPPESGLLYSGDLAATREASSGRAIEELVELYERCEGSALRRMRYVDIRRYLADGLNTKVDVATMAHGLEARAPLLDQEVVRFAMSLPDEYLIDDWGGKRVLRSLLARYVPRALFERPKRGFSLPLAPWFANELRPRVEGLSRSEVLQSTGWFDSRGIARLLDEHTASHRDHSQRIFSLLMLEEWLKQCM